MYPNVLSFVPHSLPCFSQTRYDIFLSADLSLNKAQEQVKAALDCGFLDEFTRAIIVTTTFTTFATVPESTDFHVINDNHMQPAFGNYVDVSLSILFEVPQSGIVRGWHSIVVTDRTHEIFGPRSEFFTILALTVVVFFRFLLYCAEYKMGHDHDVVDDNLKVTKCMLFLKLLSVFIWVFGYVAYMNSFDAAEFFNIFDDSKKILPSGNDADELYFFCSLQGYLEKNSGAGRKRDRVRVHTFWYMPEKQYWS